MYIVCVKVRNAPVYKTDPMPYFKALKEEKLFKEAGLTAWIINDFCDV